MFGGYHHFRKHPYRYYDYSICVIIHFKRKIVSFQPHGCNNSSDASHLEREPRLRCLLHPKALCRGISWYKTKIQMQITFASGLFWSNYSIFTKFNVGMISDLRNSSCSFKGLRPSHQPRLLRREFNRENTSTITPREAALWVLSCYHVRR